MTGRGERVSVRKDEREEGEGVGGRVREESK